MITELINNHYILALQVCAAAHSGRLGPAGPSNTLCRAAPFKIGDLSGSGPGPLPTTFTPGGPIEVLRQRWLRGPSFPGVRAAQAAWRSLNFFFKKGFVQKVFFSVFFFFHDADRRPHVPVSTLAGPCGRATNQIDSY